MFEPKLEVLPPTQREVWNELKTTPDHFVLYEGTALSLRLGHRSSVDFDFFSSEPFSPGDLQPKVPYLQEAQRLQSEPNTLTCLVQRRGETIKISFFGGLDMAKVGHPQQTSGNGIWVASLSDLAATKLKVIQDRAEAKDYLDLARLLDENVGLSDMVRAAMGVYGPAFNPMISMRALTFFQDGDLYKLDPAVQKKLQNAVAETDLDGLDPMPPGTLQNSAQGEGMRSLSQVARRLIWWKEPEESLRDRLRLIAQIMVYGDLEDTQAMLRAFNRDELLQVLDSPPPGVFTDRAWSFWHVYLHKEPRQLPERFSESTDTSS